MQRAELIEYVRLELEGFWDALPELEGGAYAFLDNAILIVRDELQTLDLGPQETLSLLQMMSEDKLSSLQFVASLPLSGDDANPQLLTREQASELLACSIANVDRLIKDNQIKRVKVGQNVVRILRSSVVDFINQGGLE